VRNILLSRQKNFVSGNASAYSDGWDRLDRRSVIRDESAKREVLESSPQQMPSYLFHYHGDEREREEKEREMR